MQMSGEVGNNLLDAISRGTTDGLKLAINVGVMLLVFTALIFMLNKVFFGGNGWLELADKSRRRALGLEPGHT